MTIPAGLIDALRSQRQCDEDGIDCRVSRQAVDEAIAILSVLAAAPSPPSGWLGIESAPKDGTPILATGLNSGRGPDRHFVVASCTDFTIRDDSDGSDLEYIDFWMPLPPPPEALSKMETTTPQPEDKTEDRANG